MFYKTIGFVVWNGGKWYVRRRYGGTLKLAAGLAVVTVLVAGYVAARGEGEAV